MPFLQFPITIKIIINPPWEYSLYWGRKLNTRQKEESKAFMHGPVQGRRAFRKERRQKVKEDISSKGVKQAMHFLPKSICSRIECSQRDELLN